MRPIQSSLFKTPVPRFLWPRIAVSRHIRPQGAGHLVFVQFVRNRLGGMALAELSENLSDDLCLIVIDGALTGAHLAVFAETAHHVIAIRFAAPGTTGLDAPAQATTGLLPRSFRKSRFMVPLRPKCNSLISPSDNVTIRTP